MTGLEKNGETLRFTVHLVSDATGTTIHNISRACLAQFDGIEPEEKIWPLVRNAEQLEKILARIAANPGPVLFTLIDENHRRILQNRCHELGIPSMAILDPVMKGFSAYLGLSPRGVPGLQHAIDQDYFERMEAVDFALSYDDGRNLEGIEDSDVILIGVSRTSKTPTCIFLAKRGIRAANIPLCPGVPFPEQVTEIKGPLFVGLLHSAENLVHIRRNRLHVEGHAAQYQDNAYLDFDAVKEELREARKLFARHGWPIIDTSRRSVEETAAEVQNLLQAHRDKKP